MSGDGFLARWSRRKRGLAPEARDKQVAPEAREMQVAPQERPMPDAPAPAESTSPLAEAPPPPAPLAPAPPDAPTFDPASLPPVEDLTAHSDYAAFLHQEVPEALRRAALRRAWSLDPAIRDFVGPADYAWDYNAPDGVPGGALDLVGDVQQMLAQALGLGDVAEPPPMAEPAPAEAAAAEAPAFIPPAALVEAPPEAPPPPEARDVADPVPRRHGSARPG